MGSVWEGGENEGRDGRVEEGMEVLACEGVCVKVCEGVCVCQVRVAGRWMRSKCRRSRFAKYRVAERVQWKEWAMGMSGGS